MNSNSDTDCIIEGPEYNQDYADDYYSEGSNTIQVDTRKSASLIPPKKMRTCRTRVFLQNLDGTEMSADDFIQAFDRMNRDGKPIEIKDFGRVNTAYAKLEEQDRLKEEAKKAKRAQYLVEIEHAKLLLPPKAEPG